MWAEFIFEGLFASNERASNWSQGTKDRQTSEMSNFLLPKKSKANAHGYCATASSSCEYCCLCEAHKFLEPTCIWRADELKNGRTSGMGYANPLIGRRVLWSRKWRYAWWTYASGSQSKCYGRIVRTPGYFIIESQ